MQMLVYFRFLSQSQRAVTDFQTNFLVQSKDEFKTWINSNAEVISSLRCWVPSDLSTIAITNKSKTCLSIVSSVGGEGEVAFAPKCLFCYPSTLPSSIQLR